MGRTLRLRCFKPLRDCIAERKDGTGEETLTVLGRCLLFVRTFVGHVVPVTSATFFDHCPSERGLKHGEVGWRLSCGFEFVGLALRPTALLTVADILASTCAIRACGAAGRTGRSKYVGNGQK